MGTMTEGGNLGLVVGVGPEIRVEIYVRTVHGGREPGFVFFVRCSILTHLFDDLPADNLENSLVEEGRCFVNSFWSLRHKASR